ncbi:hypothetical protein BK809_0007128 [Diplodia seriata]|uniref:Uncharacterized protein n=1 Tax=Diplodia seriata TaxID=420778 RepID=A0A1S8BHR0_9PEZI|nr:hypothetical protein BK809_0007128 [Diplodia seriata]
MYGSVRVLCAAAGELRDIPKDGHVKWGDRKSVHQDPCFGDADIIVVGQGPLYRRAGLSGGPVGEIVPDELYAGCPPSAEIANA